MGGAAVGGAAVGGAAVGGATIGVVHAPRNPISHRATQSERIAVVRIDASPPPQLFINVPPLRRMIHQERSAIRR